MNMKDIQAEGVLASSVFLNLFHPDMVLDPTGNAIPLAQLGIAIMLGKPLIVVCDSEHPLPAKLALIADRVIVVPSLREGGLSAVTEEIQAALQELGNA